MTNTPKTSVFARLPILVILLVAVIGGGWFGPLLDFELLRNHRAALLEWQSANAALFAVGFVVTYAAIVAFSLPGAAVLSVAGGYLFGLWLGVVLNVTGATIGAVAIFWAARMGLGHSLAARLDQRDPRLKRARAALVQNAANVMLLMRLLPLVPFFVVNLLPALVGVRFWTYLWTTAVGIIPGAFVFTSVGVGLGEVLNRGETPDLSIMSEPYVIGPILGLAALSALPLVVKAMRRRAPLSDDKD